MKSRILLAALPLAVFFAACGDPSGPGGEPPGADESRIAINYTGAVSGTFVATGGPDVAVVPARQTFAVANRVTDGALEVTAYKQNGTSSFNVASITVPQPAVGQVAVDRFCGADQCPEVTLALELGHTTGSAARYTCHLDEGTIRISALSSTRVKGSASGTGICIPGSGGDFVDFQVTSGTFEVDFLQR